MTSDDRTHPRSLALSPTVFPSSFRYAAKAGMLVCSDNVYEDGHLTKVPENDEKWQVCDHTALVYDDTSVRLWDMWTGRPIATIALNTGKHKHSGDMSYSLMPGTEYVSLAHSFASLRLRLRPAHGDEGDYDVSEKYIAYITKLPELPEA